MIADIRFYGHLLLRRLPLILLITILSTAGGLFIAAGLPTTYMTQARLLVQGQSISEDLAESTVQIGALEEVQLLREQVLTRASLIEIARRFDVFENINAMNPDQVFGAMSEATTVRTQGGDGGRRNAGSPVLLILQFEARDGQIATDVLNEYVTRILAASVRLRTGQASETLSFFQQEVSRLSDELERQSGLITDFQRRNADALPADQDFRLQRQSLLQERLAAAERDRRALMQERERTVEVFAAGATPAGTAALPPDQQELQRLENELADALLIFSETAPQVQTLQRRITLLEERIAQQSSFISGAPTAEEAPADILDPVLALRLAEIDSQVETLDVTIEETTVELEELASAISRTPLNSIQMQRLQRDYDNIQLQFENARNALARASIGERLEVGGRGQRITLLEPPVLPSRPASPNRQLIAAGAGAAGLALALTLFLGLELLNRSIRRPVELVRRLGVTPFATLPYIETASGRFWRRTRAVTAAVVVLVGTPAVLWSVNEYYIPLDQLSERVLDRLGMAGSVE